MLTALQHDVKNFLMDNAEIVAAAAFNILVPDIQGVGFKAKTVILLVACNPAKLTTANAILRRLDGERSSSLSLLGFPALCSFCLIQKSLPKPLVLTKGVNHIAA